MYAIALKDIKRIYILGMDTWSQSSIFSMAPAEAFDLLRHAPLLVKVSGSPVLHYQAPLGIWEGAPIHYHLVSGLVKTSWRGSVVALEGTRFSVRLTSSFPGPFRVFKAEHVLEAEGAAVIIRDNIEFESTLDTFTTQLVNAQCAYSFEGRRWSAQAHSEAKTRAMESLPHSNTAG